MTLVYDNITFLKKVTNWNFKLKIIHKILQLLLQVMSCFNKNFNKQYNCPTNFFICLFLKNYDKIIIFV